MDSGHRSDLAGIGQLMNSGIKLRSHSSFGSSIDYAFMGLDGKLTAAVFTDGSWISASEVNPDISNMKDN